MTPPVERPLPLVPVARDGRLTTAVEEVARQLCDADDGLARPPVAGGYTHLPSREAVAAVVGDLLAVLFPGYFGTLSVLSREALSFHIETTLLRAARVLGDQMRRAFCFGCDLRDPAHCPECDERADRLTAAFLARLPEVRRVLATDVTAAYEGDPAAISPSETILCYPGVYALACQRLAHELHLLGVPLLPRLVTEHAHSETGVDIHPGAEIGKRFFIDHGTGVVIGETAVIGNGVRLYQGVTLGALNFPLDEQGHPVKGIPRHPIVEDDVIIYGGATVLGRITIGAGSVIGGNVWLTKSVPPGSRVSQGSGARARLGSAG
jgi:serine O-acetyltransferase